MRIEGFCHLTTYCYISVKPAVGSFQQAGFFVSGERIDHYMSMDYPIFNDVSFNYDAILAVDEPANRLDAEACDYLYPALRFFNGTGLLVSHDRLFLDRLTNRNWHITRKEGIKNHFILKEL